MRRPGPRGGHRQVKVNTAHSDNALGMGQAEGWKHMEVGTSLVRKEQQYFPREA